MTIEPTAPEVRRSEIEFQQLAEKAAQLEEENERLEETLRRNLRVFEELLLSGDAGITLTGPDRRIVRVIKGLTGFNPDSLVGVPIESLAVEEDRQIIIDAYHELIEQRHRQIRVDVRVKNIHGDVAIHSVTLTDKLEDPDIQGIVCNYSRFPLPETVL